MAEVMINGEQAAADPIITAEGALVGKTSPLPANEYFSCAQITATTQVKTGAGLLGGIFVSSISGSPTMTIYNDAGGGTTNKLVDTFSLVAGSSYPFPANFTNGLNIVISGTASVSVFYA